MHLSSCLLFFLPSLACAWAPPAISGYNLVWSDSFAGQGGTSPSGSTWNIRNDNNVANNEWQDFRSSTRNVQLSGGNTLQIVPWRENATRMGWTSGRLESWYTFTPQAGKRTIVQAAISFGKNPTSAKKGIWPAFWLLGDPIRQPGGPGWPACGELDIMEQVNGDMWGHGTAHCQGYCNSNPGTGRTNKIAIPDNNFHTWQIVIDRTGNDWWWDTITWYMDGRQFHRIQGQDMTGPGWSAFNALTNTPMFIILNVAVGGDWVCSVSLLMSEVLTCVLICPLPTARPPQWPNWGRLRLHDGGRIRRSLCFAVSLNLSLLLICPSSLSFIQDISFFEAHALPLPTPFFSLVNITILWHYP